MNNSIKISLIVAGTLIIIALIAFSAFMQIIPNNTSTISAKGNSLIKVNPDIITVYFNVITNSSSAKDSSYLNQLKTDEIITDLIKYDFEKNNIQSDSYSSYEDIDWRTSKPIGYKTVNSMKVVLNSSDIKRVGTVIDIISNRNIPISYINYELSSELESKYRQLALKQATEDATNQVKAMISGADKKLGKLVSISDTSYNYYPWPMYKASDTASFEEAASEAKLAITNIQPSDRTITASVSVTYKVI